MLRARILSRIIALLLPLCGTICLIFLHYSPVLSLASDSVVINEVDAETPGTDTAEFVELFDGGKGHTDLDGLVLVFFNGQDDQSYRTFDLAGYQSSDEGYFILGNESVAGVDLSFADNVLQNGPDAVALYLGQAGDFPNGTAVTTTNLLDALVYDSDDPDDAGLLILLQAGQPQVDEDSRDLAEFHSNQRCPNGDNAQRQTEGYRQDLPTPRAANTCPVAADQAPEVSSTSPPSAATGVGINSNIMITFSEEVLTGSGWYAINCAQSGAHTASVSGSGSSYTLNPTSDFAYAESCTTTITAALITDADSQDPPDQMAGDYSWSFTTEPAPVASAILINEVDADTPDSDTAEFIELYDGGDGSTRLDGLVAVLFNGSGDSSYRAVDLDGYSTDGQGYFVMGSAAVTAADLLLPDGALQNGPDAVAIYQGSGSDFPSGTAVTTSHLLDALVYDTDDEDDTGLLPLLNNGQVQVNESSRDSAATDSNQRCPNGSGGQRNTDAYLQNRPTPGASNKCDFDSAPKVQQTSPAAGQQNVAQNAKLTVTFSEAVTLSGAAFDLACSISGSHETTHAGGPLQYTVSPLTTFAAGESCTASVVAGEISDVDTDDPPDQMAHDYSWSFSVKTIPLATHMVINEVDADTPGADTAEFIELFDGGDGETRLDGLVIVFYNGSDDSSYRAVDLDGYKTDPMGYFLAGSTAVPSIDLILPDGAIQNGADAAALYAASSSDFPQGSPVHTNRLLDALVYDTNDEDDPGLMRLLADSQPQTNEDSRGNKDYDASQRCPNGEGGQRKSAGFLQNPATPGAANNCTADTPPKVQSTSPAKGENDVPLDSDLIVRFNEDVAVDGKWFGISCSQSLEHPAVSKGGPKVFTLDPESNFVTGEQCIVMLFADAITDLDGLPQPMTADYSWQFSTGLPLFGQCGDPATPVHIIQGDGPSSPLDGAEAVIVEGVVTAAFQGNQALNGFFLQEEETEKDGKAETSEGLFIYDEGFGGDVEAGEIVRVQGSVLELDGLTSLAELTALERCSQGAVIDPLPISLPVPELASWEHIEAMLVTLDQELIVSDNGNLGSEGVVDLAANSRLFYPTETAEPGEAARLAGGLNDRSRIKLDDGSSQSFAASLPPYLGPDNTLRIGDSLPGVSGILTNSAAGAGIHPTEPVSFTRLNSRPSLPPAANGALRTAVFDSGGYFNGDGQGNGFPTLHGAATAEEFARQRAKIINALLGLQADIIGLLSLENDGYGTDSALQDLLRGLNGAAPPGTSYDIVASPRPELDSSEMAVGLILRRESVRPRGSCITIEGPPFDSSHALPLIQTVADIRNNESFTLALTQLHGRDQCPPAGDPNSDQNDGQACWNQQRTLALESLAAILQTDPTGSEDGDFLIMGNLSSYTREEPLAVLATAGYTNLTARFIDSGYSSVSFGESGTLIHAFASRGMVRQTATAVQWHINADEPSALDYRMVNPPSLFSPSVSPIHRTRSLIG